MKQSLSNVLTGILVLCALAVTGMMVRREFFAPEGPPVARVDGWQKIAREGHALGSAAAPVTIIEYSDFQCPFCAQAHRELKQVRAKWGNRLNVVFRHYPLESHAHAFEAAVAAECAAEQGRFDAYHDRLFTLQDSIGVRGWEQFARDAQVANLAAFDQCLESTAVRGRVERDRKLGAGLGTRGTPTFIVNGKMFKGALTAAQWDPWIERALADAS
jgi:protein-disulfide isomerase